MDAATVETETLLREWRALMLRTLARQRVAHDLAEDLVQESLAVAWRARDKLRNPRRACSWLRSIVLNRMRAHFTRSRETAALEHEPVTQGLSPLESAMRTETGANALRMFARLSRQQFRMLWLRHGCGMRPQQIARELGIDSEVLRHRLHKSRLLLLEGLRTRAARETLHACELGDESASSGTRMRRRS